MRTDRKGKPIRTFTGKYFWPLDPCPNEVDIRDIAHHLSNICRFTGAVSRFFSVGQHSVHVSEQFDRFPKNMQGLLHDASEAYICDVARPVKEMIPEYREIEDRIMFTIAEKFELPWPFPVAIKNADTRMLLTEKRDLMNHVDDRDAHMYYRNDGLEPYPDKLRPWTPSTSEEMFLARFEECKP